MEPSGKALAGIALLEGLPEKSLERLAQRCHWQTYRGHDLIIDRDSDSRDVFLVVSGKVRVVNYSSSGREIAFDEIDAGGFFGELAALDGLPRSATVVALTSTTVATMNPSLFEDLVNAYPRAGLRVMRSMAHVVRQASERIMDLSTLGANNRVQAEILRLARASSDGGNQAAISPIPVHGDIASRVSTTRETVARVLSELARAGIVERGTDALLVNDLNGLEELVETLRS